MISISSIISRILPDGSDDAGAVFNSDQIAIGVVFCVTFLILAIGMCWITSLRSSTKPKSRCPQCNGDGRLNGWTHVPCWKCGGYGTLEDL